MRPRPIKPSGLSAPGLSWRERTDSWVAYWVARGDLVKRGYSLRSVRLWPPSTQTVYTEPTPDEWAVISSGCERLQSEMLEWANPIAREYDPRSIYDGTLNSLKRIYHEDPDSPFHDLRFETKRTYSINSNSVCSAVGMARIPELTFRDFKNWHKGFCQPKKPGGPLRKSRGHGLMTHVRIIIGFGALLRLPGCKDAKETLSAMEFEAPRRREEFMTAEQAVSFCRQARVDGCPSIALAQALMFDLGARQKDVIGEWVPNSEPGLSSVLDHGKKWIVGMTWEEIEGGILTHRLSKSLARGDIQNSDAGKTKRFDLSLYPMVAEEMALVPMNKRNGPLIVDEQTGLPWRGKVFQRRWRKVAKAAGLPPNIQNRDSRAGAATEADNLNAGEERIRKALGHSKATTTRIYLRDEDKATAEIAILRAKNRPQTS